MGTLVITDADGKVIEQYEIDAASVSGELNPDAKPMVEDGVVQFHRAFQRERKPKKKPRK